MKRNLVAIGCALAFAAGGALAQQQQTQSSGGTSPAGSNSSGTSLTDKAKQAAQTVGEKTKQAAEKVKDKTQETAQKAKSNSDQTAQSGGQDTKAMGASGSSGSSGSANDPLAQRQKQADADLKSAKAQCEPIQQKAQKTLCEKKATAAHANAEVQIEQARVAQSGNTSAMGAGKSSQ
jgi:hypothetical protein